MSPSFGPLSFIPPTTLSAAMSYFEFEEVDVVSEMDFSSSSLHDSSWRLLFAYTLKKVSFRVLGCHNLVKLYSKQLAEAARQLLSCYYIMHGKLSFSSLALAFTCLEKKLLSQVGLLSWQLGLRRFLRLSF